MLTSEELKAIRERCEKATPGTWKLSDCGIVGGEYPDKITSPTSDVVVACCNDYGDAWVDMEPNDAAFIAAARADISALLDTVEELSQDRDRLRDAVVHDSRAMAAVFSILRDCGLGDYHSMAEGVQALASKVEGLRGLLMRTASFFPNTWEDDPTLWTEIEEALK